MAMTGQSEVIEILGWTARKVPAATASRASFAASKDPAVSLAALAAIWYATKDARAVVPDFLALVAVEKTRSGAAYRLSEVGARAAFAVGALREAHAEATDAEVRRYLAETIEKIERR